MDNEYSVKLSVKLDDKSITGVKKEIEEKFKDTEIKVKIDPDELGKASKEIQAVSAELKQITEQSKGLRAVSLEASKIAESLKGTSDVAAAVADDIERFKRSAPKKEDATGIQAVADGVKEVAAAFADAEEVATALGVKLDDFKVKSTSLDTANKEITTYTNNLKDVLTITKQTSDGVDLYSGKLKVLGDGAKAAAQGTEELKKKTSDTKESVTSLANALSSIGLSEKTLASEFNLVSTSVDNLGNSITKYNNSAGQTVIITQKGSGEMATYSAKVNTSQAEVKKAQIAQQGLGEAIKKTTGYVRDQSFASGDWMYNWTKAMQSYLTYMTVQKLSQNFGRAIKDMVEQVKELDSALVELQKVTTLSGRELDSFVESAYKAGETVAKTGTEMIQAATSFAKAGYKDQALQLGTVAAMYTNIADEAVDAADAADMIIAQMKAFNIEAENTTHIIDAINEVSNNFAVSSADIATNLGKASAVMANAGNSFEQMIGLMTAGTEITRNASKVANGLKTITLRLQGMNDEGEKDLQLTAQMEGLFNKLGISVYNTSGQLKNTYEILGTLAEVYTTLTNAEKAYVTETIAGKYQAQNAAAILMNWKTAVDATSTALDSNGSAAAENAKVLDSIRGHIQQLNSAWENFSRQIIDSDLIKGIVDLGTAFLNFSNEFGGKFLIKSAALTAAFSALYVVFNKLSKVWQSGKDLLKSLNTEELKSLNIKKSVIHYHELQLMRDKLQNVEDKKEIVNQETLNVLKEKYNIILKKGATTEEALIAVNGALKVSYIGLAGAISIASLLITGIIEAINSFKDNRQNGITKAIEDVDKLNNTLSDTDGTISSIKRLKATLDDDKSSYEDSVSAREELIKIQNELKKTYGQEADNVDLVTDSIDENIRKIKEWKKEKAQAYLDDNRSKYEDAKDDTSGKNSYTRDISFKLNYGDKGVEDILNKYGETYYHHSELWGSGQKWSTDSVEQSKKGLEELKKYYLEHEKVWVESGKMTQEQFNKQYAYITGELDEITKKFSESYELITKYQEQMLNAKGYELLIDDIKKLAKENVLTEQSVQTLIDKYPGLADAMELNGVSIKDLIKDYQNINIVIDKNVEDINKSIDTFNNKRIRRSDILKIPDNKDATQEEIDAYNRLKEMADKAGISIEALINVLVQKNAIMADAGTYEQEMSNITTQWAEGVKNFVKDLESLDNAFKTTSEAQKEYNQYGYFSIETLEKLMQLDFQYIDALVTESGEIKNNVNWYKEQLKAKLNQEEIEVTEIYLKKLLAIESNKHALAMAKEADAATILNKAYGNITKSLPALQEEIAKTKALLNGDVDGQSANVQKAMAQAEKEYKKYMAILKAGWKGINKYGSSGYAGSSSSKSKSSSAGNQKQWWELAFDDLKGQYDNSQITINNYLDGLEKLLGQLGKGTEGWNKIHKELQKQKLDKIKDDYNAGRISLNQYINALQNLQQAYKEGTKEWNNLANAIKKAKLDKLKKDNDDLKAALDAVNSTLDKQIENYEKLKDEAEKAYDAELDGLNDTKDALEKQDDEYQNAQKAIIKYLKEQLDALKKQKDDIDDYYDDVIDTVDKLNDEEEKALELAEAYEALMNAMTQKTKKVWREGLGWVWEADQKAIADAKKTYDDLIHSSTIEDIEKQKVAIGKSLEDQIDALNNYVDSWEDVLSKYGDDKDHSLATKLLGENWQELASQLDPQIVKDFSDAYYQLQKSLDDTDQQIEQLNKLKEESEKYWDELIDGLKKYKDKWGDVSEDYQDAQNKLIANQVLIADWEKNILDQRLEALENFKNKYNTIMDAINLVNNMSDDNASSYNTPTLPGFSKGGEVDFTGLAMLHGTPSRPEYVFNNDQIRNILSNITKPQVTSAFAGGNGTSVNNYNFGNIELPNVNNAQQFISELKSLVNTTRNL